MSMEDNRVVMARGVALCAQCKKRRLNCGKSVVQPGPRSTHAVQRAEKSNPRCPHSNQVNKRGRNGFDLG